MGGAAREGVTSLKLECQGQSGQLCKMLRQAERHEDRDLTTGFAEVEMGHDLAKEGFSGEAEKRLKRLPKVTQLVELQSSEREKRVNIDCSLLLCYVARKGAFTKVEVG